MPQGPILDEVVVQAGGDPFSFNYIEAFMASTSQNYDQPRDTDYAFAPPEPVLLPEVVVEPASPPLPVPGLVDAIIRRLPWLALLAPGAMGGAGEGDAPMESSSVANRHSPPPPPPTINPVFEDFNPPNWNDLSKGGDSSLLDTVYLTPFAPFLEPVELPDNMKYFDVSPPPVVTRPIIEVPNDFTFTGPQWELQPYPTGPRSRPAPSPFSDPGIGEPLATPAPGDRSLPRVSPQPYPTGDIAPDLFVSPLPDGVGDPIGDPFVTPGSPPRAVPEPANPVGIGPRDTPNPFADPIGGANPRDTVEPIEMPLPQPDPFTPNKDQCQCAKKKKKKPKKRKPRDVCYRGTYLELRKGISKTRLEEVPCSDTAPKKPKISTPRRRKKTPTWDDTLRDVFQLP